LLVFNEQFAYVLLRTSQALAPFFSGRVIQPPMPLFHDPYTRQTGPQPGYAAVRLDERFLTLSGSHTISNAGHHRRHDSVPIKLRV
jgi:hypothetical protein